MNMITKKALPRRTILRGLGAAIALPFLDGMVPAFTAIRATAAQPIRRFGVIYVPNGMMMPSWTPSAEGAGFEMTAILKPIEAFRERMLVLSGLDGTRAIRAGGPHSNASTRFLSGVPYMGTMNGTDILAEQTMDQILAKELGQYTQLSSLELSLDRGDLPGACEANYACKYPNTISWRGPTTPQPMENDPRAVFERLFGDSGSTDAKVRLARLTKDKSILDSVVQRVAELQRGLGTADRARLGEYLDAVRDLERRIQKAEEQSSRELPLVEQPAGVPGVYSDYAKLMFDLQVLAYQCDLTRVITFMMGRELTTRTFPEIDVADGFHPTSHHQGDAKKIATLTKIETFHMTLLAYYLEKLKATPDGDGSLLDHITILFGAGISDSNAHANTDLPIVLLGGGAGQLKGGRHLRYPNETPMANLLVTLLDKLGTPVEKLGNSTGKLPIDALSLA
ncbi:MAG: hypothetical protein JWL71_3832 [Acidobacteria bacterium]|nr:hypothetical protein [Acidobacteriota bacterium]